MKKIIVGSLNQGAGKTSVIIGLAKALNKSIGYVKPFGDRLLYKKKRLWDYDSALMTSVFDLGEKPEEMSLGFEHAKLRFMYDENTVKEKLNEVVEHNGRGKEVLFIEAGQDLACGSSVNMDVFSLAKDTGGELILVVSGDENAVIDNITFVRKYVETKEVDFKGVIINKVKDVEDFKNTYLSEIEEVGVKVLGVLPHSDDLACFTMGYLADCLFAKVVAGERNLGNHVKKIYIGAMSASSVLATPLFKVGNKLIITAGDRSDMIIAGLETNTSGIILTNNILPPSNIVSKAEDMGVPMLLVSGDTYQISKKIDNLEALITKDSPDKVEILANMLSCVPF